MLHSLLHTFLTRLGEAGFDAFTIMRIAGHSSVTVSQKYEPPRQRLWSAPSSGLKPSMQPTSEKPQKKQSTSSVSATLPNVASERVM